MSDLPESTTNHRPGLPLGVVDSGGAAPRKVWKTPVVITSALEETETNPGAATDGTATRS
jgi:hypothetical protein